jgi:hypothetical protein
MAALSLLLADESPAGSSMTDDEIIKITGLSSSTIQLLRKRCCKVDPLAALERKQRETPPRPIKITGEVQAVHQARQDSEYVREGSVTGFMVAMPHKGERDVFMGVDGRRTSKDYAACIDHIANTLFSTPATSSPTASTIAPSSSWSLTS